MATPLNTPAKVWARTLISDDGCWIWQGYRNAKGYGQVSWKGRVCLAHRVTWEIAHDALSDEQCVLHHCDTPACCNPKHLFLGSRADNNADKAAKGRAAGGTARGERHGCSRLTWAAVREIRVRYAAGERQAPLAREYGVTETQIHNIVTEKHWREAA